MVRWKYMSSDKKNTLNLHPWKLTWNLKITLMTRNIIFLTSIFGFQPLIFQGVHFLNDDFSGSPESQEFGSLSDGVLILKNGFFVGCLSTTIGWTMITMMSHFFGTSLPIPNRKIEHQPRLLHVLSARNKDSDSHHWSLVYLTQLWAWTKPIEH